MPESAPTVLIPARQIPGYRIPTYGIVAPGNAAGRGHRSSGEAVARAVDVVARLGSLITLCALLIVGGTAGSAVDGVAPTADSAVAVTFDGDRR